MPVLHAGGCRCDNGSHWSSLGRRLLRVFIDDAQLVACHYGCVWFVLSTHGDMARVKATSRQLNDRRAIVLERAAAAARRAAVTSAAHAKRANPRTSRKGKGPATAGRASGPMARASQSGARRPVVRRVARASVASSIGTLTSTEGWSPSERSSEYLPGSPGAAECGIRQPRRLRPGALALRDIERFRQSTKLLIPKQPFVRLVRELAGNVQVGLRFQQEAVEALQDATEAFVVTLFEDCVLCAEHAKRVTVTSHDMALALRIRGGASRGA